jgi:hypothetical protein
MCISVASIITSNCVADSNSTPDTRTLTYNVFLNTRSSSTYSETWYSELDTRPTRQQEIAAIFTTDKMKTGLSFSSTVHDALLQSLDVIFLLFFAFFSLENLHARGDEHALLASIVLPAAGKRLTTGLLCV